MGHSDTLAALVAALARESSNLMRHCDESIWTKLRAAGMPNEGVGAFDHPSAKIWEEH
jgi:hypothetical protein